MWAVIMEVRPSQQQVLIKEVLGFGSLGAPNAFDIPAFITTDDLLNGINQMWLQRQIRVAYKLPRHTSGQPPPSQTQQTQRTDEISPQQAAAEEEKKTIEDWKRRVETYTFATAWHPMNIKRSDCPVVATIMSGFYPLAGAKINWASTDSNFFASIMADACDPLAFETHPYDSTETQWSFWRLWEVGMAEIFSSRGAKRGPKLEPYEDISSSKRSKWLKGKVDLYMQSAPGRRWFKENAPNGILISSFDLTNARPPRRRSASNNKLVSSRNSGRQGKRTGCGGIAESDAQGGESDSDVEEEEAAETEDNPKGFGAGERARISAAAQADAFMDSLDIAQPTQGSRPENTQESYLTRSRASNAPPPRREEGREAQKTPKPQQERNKKPRATPKGAAEEGGSIMASTPTREEENHQFNLALFTPLDRHNRPPVCTLRRALGYDPHVSPQIGATSAGRAMHIHRLFEHASQGLPHAAQPHFLHYPPPMLDTTPHLSDALAGEWQIFCDELMAARTQPTLAKTRGGPEGGELGAILKEFLKHVASPKAMPPTKHITRINMPADADADLAGFGDSAPISTCAITKLDDPPVHQWSL